MLSLTACMQSVWFLVELLNNLSRNSTPELLDYVFTFYPCILHCQQMVKQIFAVELNSHESANLSAGLVCTKKQHGYSTAVRISFGVSLVLALPS